MKLPIEFWIFASVAIGTAIGYVAAFSIHRTKRSRIERESWMAASTFYHHSDRSSATRL